jgi:hypothetical protein
MVYTPIYSFSAPEGKYVEPATSLHPIKAEGYEILPSFTSLARELNFAGRTSICKILRRYVPPS